MNINLVFDQPLDALPAGFADDVVAVANFFQTQFTDGIAFDLHVGFGEIRDAPIEVGSIGRSLSFGHFYDYQAVKAALADHATSADDVSAVQALPDGNPIDGNPLLFLADAQASALSLLPSSATRDQYVGFSATASFQYDRSTGINAGSYDFMGIVAHEISEVLGRSLGVGERIVNKAPTWFVTDLFHYSDVGVPDFSRGGYASPDGGVTNLGDFNQQAAGDAGDWDRSLGNGAFLAFSPSGAVNDVTEMDLRLLDILGFKRTGEPTQAPPQSEAQTTSDLW